MTEAEADEGGVSLSTSFGAVAEAYERGRPGYPDDLLDQLSVELGIGPGRDVVDLAAGTGKLSRQLVRFGARLVAVEPLAEMRAQCERAVPSVPVHDGAAEAMPLADASADVVLVAQAYHWFDRHRATREIARVLRRDGYLVCLWNFEDVEVPWVAAVEAVKDDVSGGRRTLLGGQAWEFDLGGGDRFGDRRRRAARMTLRQAVDVFLDSFASRSYVAVLEPAARARAIDRVRDVLPAREGPIDVPYRTEAMWWRRTAALAAGPL